MWLSAALPEIWGGFATSSLLPGYAPFGKVALVRAAEKSWYMALEDLNKSNVRVIKNLGETSEAFGLENLKAAQVGTRDKNAEITSLITEGKGSGDH